MKPHKTFTWLCALLLLSGCLDLLDNEPRRQLASVTVTCTPATLTPDETAQCEPIAKDQDGVKFDMAVFWWKSSDPSVATVDGRGKVTAQLTPGTATISVRADVGTTMSMQGQATITVVVKDPTVHTGNITANETWRAADNPHLVRGVIKVEGASLPTLTIEAGAVIRFEENAALRINDGVLKALGTEQAPIQMVSNESSPTKGFWQGVGLGMAGSDTELSHVTLSHCGGASADNACLALYGESMPVLRHVTVKDSAREGVRVSFDNRTTFGPGSTALSVTGSEGYAVSIEANQADRIPTGGTFTGAVEVVGSVTRTQTWPNLGIPYVITSDLRVDAESLPVLTLAAGTVLRFAPDVVMLIGDDWGGGLIVNGTAAAPVLFTADASSPAPGHWRGVHLRQGTTSDSRISYATFEYAGAGGSDATGNLNLYGNNSFIDRLSYRLNNVTVRKGSSYGIQLLADATFAPGSSALTARDNGSYAISGGANTLGTYPSTGNSFSGNTPDAVEVLGDIVYSSQTWPNLGIPYVIKSTLRVDAEPLPVLTLAAGTVLRFAPDAAMLIGDDWGGGLIVDGTEAAPVLFTADASSPAPGHWRGVHLRQATTSDSRISHATFEYAGAGGSVATGNLNLYGNNSFINRLSYRLNNVTVQKGSSYGLQLLADATFAPGSSALTARDNGSYAISGGANTFGTYPSTGNSFSGNTPNAVEVLGDIVYSSQTWPNLGIPYVVNEYVSVGSALNPTLTIAPGTELRFGPNVEFRVGPTGTEDRPGALIAEGTAAAPIRFVANAATPAPGHWRGLHFWLASGSKLDNVIVSHAGAGGSIGTGNVNVYREIGAFVTNTTLSNSSGCGLTRSTGSHAGSTNVTTDFTAALSNTFTSNAGGTQCFN